MTLVGTARHLEKKMKIYPQMLTSFDNTSNLAKVTKVKNARAGRAKLLFLSTKYANL